MMEEVILVDEQDRPVGYMEKMAAHRDGGRRHRAFSIMIFNGRGEMLLQLRSVRKHHFGGLWTNACCSHPLRGEDPLVTTHRKLQQEMGLDTALEEVFQFTYKADDPASGLTEYEIDHVFLGRWNGTPAPDPEEADSWKWISTDELEAELAAQPERFSPWFRIAMETLLRNDYYGYTKP